MTLTDFGATGMWSRFRTSRDEAQRGWRPITLTDRAAPQPRQINLVSQVPEYLEAFVCRLNTLLALPPGWDSYGAEAVSFDNALAALGMLRRLPEVVRRPHVSANPDGEIELEWAHNDLLLVLIVNGSFDQPTARVTFDWGSDCDEWVTAADGDDRLDSALRKIASPD